MDLFLAANDRDQRTHYGCYSAIEPGYVSKYAEALTLASSSLRHATRAQPGSF